MILCASILLHLIAAINHIFRTDAPQLLMGGAHQVGIVANIISADYDGKHGIS
jgi:hypothetical protein